ncbi:MAG: 16S rRNA (cytidine(1402)-2'-O)-methyltransferase [Terrimicrobiaceae bacterium]|nr:16S rRNA (cytidine(1402)-2'-O)-methyltransferase [Terrimicrobiaceae bacterium]
MLFVVPTPIGNLGDLTLRAREVLESADVIAAEDTRHSGILMQHHGIGRPLVSFHEHNEAMRTAELLERLLAGATVALITDAGTPSISDPGVRLVRACAEAGLAYTVLPGPCAVITALVGSGLDTDAFYFGGFLPVKSGQRQAEIAAAVSRNATSIFYESPHRLLKSLATLAEAAPARLVCVARELTKKFEEYRRGQPAALVAHYMAHPPKGEICLLVEGADAAARRAKLAARQAAPA